MKPTRALATAATACFLALPLLALPGAPARSYASGAPAAFSGPEQYCNACHGSPASNPVNSAAGAVTITAPATFAPGEVVPITVTVMRSSPLPSGKQGFELSARDGTLAHAGAFVVDGTTVQYAQGVEEYVTHTASSNTAESWTFAWVAPSEDVPEAVTLYAAGNAADGDFIPDDDDEVYAAEHVMTRTGVSNEPGAAPLAFRLEAPYPNPVRTAATARYVLDRPAAVEARLLDGRGRVVRTLAEGPRGAGPHALRLDAAGLPAGTYFLTLSTPEGTQARPVSVAR